MRAEPVHKMRMHCENSCVFRVHFCVNLLKHLFFRKKIGIFY